jgi:hypothetical protein
VAVFDGSNVPKKSTDGSTWTQFGISAPASAPGLALVAGGSLVSGNVIEVSYAYQDDDLGHYGNEGDTDTETPSGADLTVRVTPDLSADPQVDTILIFARDVTAGQAVRRLVGSVANSGSPTFDITSVPSSSAIEAPTTRNVPPALSFGVPWKNRWWARDAVIKTRLRFTEIFENQSWTSDYYVDIPFSRGDEIAAVVPIGDTLLVFGKARQIFVIFGQTSLDFDVRPSAGAEAGALGPKAWALVEGGVVHAAVEGVYIFDGSTDRLLSYDIDGPNVGWSQMVSTATADALTRVEMVYDRKEKELRIAVPSVYPYGTAGEYVLDLARTRSTNQEAWTTTDRTIGGYIAWDGPEAVTGNRGRLFSWSDTIGRIYEENTGTSANGSDLVCDYEGPALSTGLNVARFTAVHGEYAPAAGTFGLELLVDGRSVLSPSVDIGGGLARYGTGTYGTSTYGGSSRRMFTKLLPLSAEGRSVTVRGTYTGQGTFEWFTYALQLVPEPAIREMV